MKKLSILFFFLFAVQFVFAQKIIEQKVWDRWDPAVIARANTALSVDYMTSNEKTLFLITNLARIDGSLFCETFLDNYLEGEPSNEYVESLYKDLKKVKNLPLLYPEKDLYNVAEGHAIKSGKIGQVGHQDFEQRFETVRKKYYGVAENCAYGYEQAMDIAILLLVDEGVPSLGHRVSMLNPDYNSLGISIQPHIDYRYNCVMDFGRLNTRQ
jgi:hypothetical protein